MERTAGQAGPRRVPSIQAAGSSCRRRRSPRYQCEQQRWISGASRMSNSRPGSAAEPASHPRHPHRSSARPARWHRRTPGRPAPGQRRRCSSVTWVLPPPPPQPGCLAASGSAAGTWRTAAARPPPAPKGRSGSPAPGGCDGSLAVAAQTPAAGPSLARSLSLSTGSLGSRPRGPREPSASGLPGGRLILEAAGEASQRRCS